MKKSLIVLSAVLSLWAVQSFAAEDGTEDILPPAPAEEPAMQLMKFDSGTTVTIPKDQEAAAQSAMDQDIPAPPQDDNN